MIQHLGAEVKAGRLSNEAAAERFAVLFPGVDPSSVGGSQS
jgi:hypothetical protein